MSEDTPPEEDFFNYTIEQVYDFYKSHLKAADDSIGPQQFSAFTFVVVDQACLKSEPYECIICSDAPDFGEADDAIVLKQVRVPVRLAWRPIQRLEELTMTSSELECWVDYPRDLERWILEMQRKPPRYVARSVGAPGPDGDENISFGLATPAEARARKRSGIKKVESLGWVPGKGCEGAAKFELDEE